MELTNKWCITHETHADFDVELLGLGCIITSCPPPEVGMTYEEVSQLEEPSEDELLLMDMNAEVLEADFIGEQS